MTGSCAEDCSRVVVVVAPPLRRTSRYCRLAARYAKTFEQRFDSKRVEQFNPANKKSASELNKAWKEQLAVYADLGSIDMVTTANTDSALPFPICVSTPRPAACTLGPRRGRAAERAARPHRHNTGAPLRRGSCGSG